MCLFCWSFLSLSLRPKEASPARTHTLDKRRERRRAHPRSDRHNSTHTRRRRRRRRLTRGRRCLSEKESGVGGREIDYFGRFSSTLVAFWVAQTYYLLQLGTLDFFYELGKAKGALSITPVLESPKRQFYFETYSSRHNCFFELYPKLFESSSDSQISSRRAPPDAFPPPSKQYKGRGRDPSSLWWWPPVPSTPPPPPPLPPPSLQDRPPPSVASSSSSFFWLTDPYYIFKGEGFAPFLNTFTSVHSVRKPFKQKGKRRCFSRKRQGGGV